LSEISIPSSVKTKATLRGSRRLSRSRWRKLIARALLIPFCLAFLIPLYWMVATSLKTNAELVALPPTLYPHAPEWNNYPKAVQYIPFGKYLVNTLTITAFSVMGAVISNTIVAYGFSRLQWPGRDMVFLVVLATVFIPFPVRLVALFDIFAKLGWINTYRPLIVPTFFGNAFFIFLLRQFMMQIPRDLSESARIDGANEVQILSSIILPLARPAIGVVALFQAINSWDDFLGPLIYLQDEAKYTLSIGLQFFRSERDIEFTMLMAASTLVVLPVIIIFFLFQRTFTEGISIGTVK
jgi:multiple sugar transport system permease protein